MAINDKILSKSHFSSHLNHTLSMVKCLQSKKFVGDNQNLNFIKVFNRFVGSDLDEDIRRQSNQKCGNLAFT